MPEAKSAQLSQMDYPRKVFQCREIRIPANKSEASRDLMMRIEAFTTCLMIMIRILNITVVKTMRTTLTAANGQNPRAFRRATVLPENRVGSVGAGNPASITSRIRHSVASSLCYWYRLSMRNRSRR